MPSLIVHADVRHPLLGLHKALVDAERVEYERSRGRLPDRDFLAALINDPELAWLRPLTALIVRLDGEEAGDDPVAEIRKLLIPNEAGSEFQRKYAEALQRSPDTVVAHGNAMRALKNAVEPEQRK